MSNFVEAAVAGVVDVAAAEVDKLKASTEKRTDDLLRWSNRDVNRISALEKQAGDGDPNSDTDCPMCHGTGVEKP